MRPTEIIFQDAAFPSRLAWVRSRLGTVAQKWVSTGMPRLGPAIWNSAFFLHEILPGNKLSPPRGTGVFVGEILNVGLAAHLYAVTAAHVVCGGASVIRINTKDGKHRLFEFDPSEWTQARDEDGYWADLAAVDVTELFREGDAVSVVPFSMFATTEFNDFVELGIGEDGFMLGLFSSHPGTESNLIAARFGNISVLAHADAPIAHGGGKIRVESPCHVFDIHSRPGFSGSPVFIYRTMDGDLRDLENRRPHTWTMRLPPDSSRDSAYGHAGRVEIFDDQNNRFLKLFGIHVSQFHDSVKITKRKKAGRAEADDPVKDGDEIGFPGSMTIVVPAWDILTLITEDEELEKKRDVRNRRAVDAALKRDSERGFSTEPEAVPEDANPHHREDFTRLLGAAAKAKPQDGQT